jgi:hypothetical protein
VTPYILLDYLSSLLSKLTFHAAPLFLPYLIAPGQYEYLITTEHISQLHYTHTKYHKGKPLIGRSAHLKMLAGMTELEGA